MGDCVTMNGGARILGHGKQQAWIRRRGNGAGKKVTR